MFFKKLSKLFVRSRSRRPAVAPFRRAVLQVESLERREVLSTTSGLAAAPAAVQGQATTITNPSPVQSIVIGNLWQAMTASSSNTQLPIEETGTNLPTTFPIYLQINSEVMEATSAAGGITFLNDGGTGTNLNVVRAVDGTNIGSHASGTTVVWLEGYQPATIPATPTGLTATAVSSSQINLSWSGVVGATGYSVDEWNGTVWTTIAKIGAASPTYSVQGLNASTTYYFEVAASNDAGTSNYSPYVSATTLANTVARPGVPANFTATAVSSSQINLNWSAVSGATGYVIDEWNGSSWQQIATTGGTSLAVNSLKASTTYFFDVAAYNSAGTGTFAPNKSATTLAAATLPGVPANFTATAVSSSQINLAWSALSGATGYVIDQWNGSAWQQIATTAGTGLAVNSLKASTTYFFDVAAYNSAGTGTFAPNKSATTLAAATLLPAPTNFKGQAISTTQVNLTWSPVSGATGYIVEMWVNGVWKQVGSPNNAATSFAIGSLTPGQTYYFEVAAFNSNGVGAFPNYVTVTVP